MMLLKLFWMFTKLGFLSFGGGYPMMALILQEARAVGLTPAEFADMAALELLASGPIAINAATYTGFLKAGLAGAAAATLGVCVSPFVLTTALYYFLARFRENRFVQAFMAAIVAGSGGILLATAGTLAQDVLAGGRTAAQIAAAPLAAVSWGGAAIAALCLVAGIRFKVNPILLVLGSGVLGVVLLR